MVAGRPFLKLSPTFLAVVSLTSVAVLLADWLLRVVSWRR
jgi:hypothetical protein